MSDPFKKAKLTMLSAMLPLIALGGAPYYGSSMPRSKPTKCKNKEEIPGREHSGMYSQPKKLRRGAGHRKLTRAQRKKRGGK